MILGVGLDICEVKRFIEWEGDAVRIGRFFSEPDAAGMSAENLAARWAAKEAFGKALGTGLRGLPLREVAVSRDDTGRPLLDLGAAARSLLDAQAREHRLDPGALRCHLSLSHDGGVAAATVIIEGE